MRTLAIALATGIAAAAGAAVAARARRWSRTTARAVGRIAAQPDSATSDGGFRGAIAGDGFAALPAAVRRYFDFALAPEQRMIRAASLRQRGVMRAGAGAAWRPFTARQHFATQPPGFVWDASMRLVAGISIRIRDGYVAGAGASEASVAGVIPIAAIAGTPVAASASLMRYLAEAAWLPTALLPQSGVRWTELDRARARATLTDGATTVSVDVEFGENGEITGFSALRYRAVNGTAVLTPWIGRFRDYARIAGMMIPTYGEVAWSPPEGAFTVWRGRVERADYEFRP